MPTNSTSKSKGFTLTELIVVLAIISILAAVLLSAFTFVREKARQSSCQSNLKQLGVAIKMYADDNSSFFPSVFMIRGSEMIDWTELVQPYVKNKQIFICPSDPLRETWSNGYGLNVRIARPMVYNPLTNHMSTPKTEGQILRPADTVLMTDAGTTPLGNVSSLQWPQKQQRIVALNEASGPDMDESGSESSAPHARHSGRSNVLWADGHVKLLPIESFYNSPGQVIENNPLPGISPCLRPEMGCSS